MVEPTNNLINRANLINLPVPTALRPEVKVMILAHASWHASSLSFTRSFSLPFYLVSPSLSFTISPTNPRSSRFTLGYRAVPSRL